MLPLLQEQPNSPPRIFPKRSARVPRGPSSTPCVYCVLLSRDRAKGASSRLVEILASLVVFSVFDIAGEHRCLHISFIRGAHIEREGKARKYSMIRISEQIPQRRVVAGMCSTVHMPTADFLLQARPTRPWLSILSHLRRGYWLKSFQNMCCQQLRMSPCCSL